MYGTFLTAQGARAAGGAASELSQEVQQGSQARVAREQGFPDDGKLDIFQTYHRWMAEGKKAAKSPIKGLMKKHGCSKQYPKRLHDNGAEGRLDRKQLGGWQAGGVFARLLGDDDQAHPRGPADEEEAFRPLLV